MSLAQNTGFLTEFDDSRIDAFKLHTESDDGHSHDDEADQHHFHDDSFILSCEIGNEGGS